MSDFEQEIFRRPGGRNEGKLLFGLVCIIGVALSWAGSTQVASLVAHTEGFDAPFFMIYYNTAWMLLCILYPVMIGKNISKTKDLIKESMEKDGTDFKKLLLLAFFFFLMWGGANYLYVRALSTTPPSVVTAVFSATPAFVFILSKIILNDSLTVLKGLSVIFSIAGIVIIALGEDMSGGSFVGIILTIGSSICAAFYKVLLKKYLGDPTMVTTAVYLVLLAAVNIFGFWWLMLALYYSGAESIPWGTVDWGYLSLTAFANLLFNCFVNFGIAYTDPLFISIGTILGIPVNMVLDVIIHSLHLYWKQIVGSVLIIIGFAFMLYGSRAQLRPEDKERNHFLIEEGKADTTSID